MAKAKNWTYTDLAQDNALYLELEGVRYEVSQYTSSFALNEIPRATLLVAVGRDARSAGASTHAKVHSAGKQLKQMLKAIVYFAPKQEWNSAGREWPEREVIFDGYYIGTGYRKINGKVQAVLHLVHWLIDLTFSSALSKTMHPTNPTSLINAAVTEGAGATSQVVFVSDLIGFEVLEDKVQTDLWSGIKTMLCSMAEVDFMEFDCPDAAGVSTTKQIGDKAKNDLALKALSRIQGPSEKCDLAYDKFGKALKLQTDGVPFVTASVAKSIGQQFMESYTHTTFWDKIVGQLCPDYCAAVVPRVTDAIIIADTPSLKWVADRTNLMKTISPDEYDGLDQSGAVTRPLRGVGVYGDWESATGYDITEPAKDIRVCVGGSYLAADEGMMLIVKSPSWLRNITGAGMFAATSAGLDKNIADDFTIPEDTPATVMPKLQALYSKFAHTVYCANMLRGRSANLSGKLRFDIAPGCIVRILAKPEQYLEGVDELAGDIIGHVCRVTININAEASLAGTSFQLTHTRTEEENLDPRTMVTEHPLFGSEIFKGAPLINNWEFAT